jgi:CO dehydrogenase maturation factor
LEEKWVKALVVTGRGGVGKTTFAALAVRYLRERGRLLVVDADPDESLAAALGLDLAAAGVRTISELLYDVRFQKLDPAFTQSIPARPDQVEYLFHQEGILEGPGFDFFAIGPKWAEGCYCQPNAILKAVIKDVGRGYTTALIDSPAGLEHLNRRITAEVDSIFALVGPSQKSFDNVVRVRRILTEVNILFRHFFLVANYEFPDDLVPTVSARTGLPCLGRVPYEEEVARRLRAGEPLLDLDDSSPACQAVSAMLREAGY